jgi:hypothetical protein
MRRQQKREPTHTVVHTQQPPPRHYLGVQQGGLGARLVSDGGVPLRTHSLQPLDSELQL